MTDDELKGMGEWLRERPVGVRTLAREWPPAGRVKTRLGVVLLVPAPGVEGTIAGYTEDGNLVVVAPLTIPHPTRGWGRDPETGEPGAPGMQVSAHVPPGQLVYVADGGVSHADVEEALAWTACTT